jgi:hypothetical protein
LPKYDILRNINLPLLQKRFREADRAVEGSEIQQEGKSRLAVSKMQLRT